MLGRAKYPYSKFQKSAGVFPDGMRGEALGAARDAQAARPAWARCARSETGLTEHYGGEPKAAAAAGRKKKFRIRLPWS